MSENKEQRTKEQADQRSKNKGRGAVSAPMLRHSNAHHVLLTLAWWFLEAYRQVVEYALALLQK